MDTPENVYKTEAGKGRNTANCEEKKPEKISKKNKKTGVRPLALQGEDVYNSNVVCSGMKR